jgi:NAD(P)-dependent dehydrogenase (short-subunit alcohol dehydrogenase family)
MSATFGEKSALLFGGARGIGKAVAMEFARRGACIAIADLDLEGAESAAREISATGGSAIALHCDVSDDASVRDVAAKAARQIGEIDIVMNNVGILIGGHPEDIPLAEWQRILNINLMSIIRSNDVFLPKMIARGSGHIVNTASFAGLYPYAANRMPYVAAKAAIVALSESLALYLLPQGVSVSCFCPGPVSTGVMQGMKNWSAHAPMRGPGTQFAILKPEQAATILADGMEAGRIFIPTDESVSDLLRRRAADPDGFIREKIDEFARGDFGVPKF